MKVRRLPALVLLPLLAAVAALADDPRGPMPPVDTTSELGVLMPAADPPGALSSTWYCAGGTAEEGGAADHVVVVANASDQPVTAAITVYPGALDTDPNRAAIAAQGTTLTTLDVPALGRASVRLGDVVTAPIVSALVEAPGGDIAVEHQLSGPLGVDAGPCASAASDSWYFPTGATTLDARELLVLFNPFPDAATVDLTFATDDGPRTPEPYDGLVVAGGTSLAVEITPVVTRRTQIATSVRTRTGRLIVDRLLLFDGSGGKKGMTMTLGVPHPARTWHFPDGLAEVGIAEVFTIYNPSAREANVDVAVALDDPGTNGEVEPFDVTVPAAGYAQVIVNNEQRIPVGVSHSTIVHSRNGVDVVAERDIYAGDPAARAGAAATMGSPLAANRWVMAAGAATETVDEWIVVQNPSDSIARIDVSALTGGQAFVLTDLQDVEIAAGGRLAIRLGDHLDRDELTVLVEATEPVVVERGLYQVGDIGISQAIGIPLQ
jgi:hypothetical protein